MHCSCLESMFPIEHCCYVHYNLIIFIQISQTCFIYVWYHLSNVYIKHVSKALLANYGLILLICDHSCFWETHPWLIKLFSATFVRLIQAGSRIKSFALVNKSNSFFYLTTWEINTNMFFSWHYFMLHVNTCRLHVFSSSKFVQKTQTFWRVIS